MEQRKYSIDEVFEMIGYQYLVGNKQLPRLKNKDEIIVDGYRVWRSSLRYRLFFQKGTTCVNCGRKGTYFVLDENHGSQITNRRHFNLYSDDGVLITKDHIIPKSKGGRDTLDNLQTMCVICNEEKGNEI